MPSYLLPNDLPKKEEEEDLVHQAEQERQIKAGQQIVTELLPPRFEKAVSADALSFVEFYAPWCIKCKEVSKTFYRAAYLTSIVDTDIKFFRFDCSSSREMMDVCKKYNVIAFPAIYIYGQHEQFTPFDNAIHVYNGKRSPEAISSYALYLHDVVFKGKVATPEQQAEVNAKGGDSRFYSPSCRIEASVPMNKVPTEILIKAVSDYHYTNTSIYTVSHTIHHLSMGRMLPEFRLVSASQRDNPEKVIEQNKKFKKSIRDIRNKISFAYYNTYGPRAQKRVEQGKMINLKSDKGQAFKSKGPLAYDHYVRVVPISLIPTHGKEMNDYDYTLATDRYTVDYGTTPRIVIQVEISPMRLVLEETYKSLSSSFLNLMAIVGGVYSSMLIFESLFSGGVNILAKKQD